MKVLHVTDADLPARRFKWPRSPRRPGHQGHTRKQAVLRKSSDNPDVVSLFDGRGDEDLQSRLQEVERRHSINNLLFPWGRLLAETKEFRDADNRPLPSHPQPGHLALRLEVAGRIEAVSLDVS